MNSILPPVNTRWYQPTRTRSSAKAVYQTDVQLGTDEHTRAWLVRSDNSDVIDLETNRVIKYFGVRPIENSRVKHLSVARGGELSGPNASLESDELPEFLDSVEDTIDLVQDAKHDRAIAMAREASALAIKGWQW